MSKKKPITIEIDKIKVASEFVFLCKVIPSGNGAVIPFYKKFRDKEVYVIIKEKTS